LNRDEVMQILRMGGCEDFVISRPTQAERLMFLCSTFLGDRL